jgi:UMF1 family MFS transporter
VSSKGWSFGYLGGFTLLVINLALVTSHESLGLTQAQAVRWSLFSAGLWWAVFTIVPFIGLRKLPAGRVVHLPVVAGRGMVGASFGQLAHTLRHLAGFRNTWMFLLAYLLFNDGIQTVIASASVFGEAEIGLATEQLLFIIAIVQAVAFVGALLFGRIAARLGAKRTILIGLVLWSGVSATGFFLPKGEFVPFLAMSVVIGLVLGGTQALSRSLFSQLIPAGREAEYFSLYQAAERGTSWVGTLMFGLVFQATGSYRPAVASLLVFFVVGGVLLSRVRVREGIQAAGNPVPAVI